MTARRTDRIDILAFAPLPLVGAGAVTFQPGVAIFYAQLLPRLASAGHSVRVVTEAPAPGNVGRGERCNTQIPNLSIDWCAFGYRSGTLPPTRSYRDGLERRLRPIFLREVRRRRPDVVLIGREILAPYVGELCRAHDLPCVVVAHGVALAALLSETYPERERRRMAGSLRQVALVVTVAKHLEDDLRPLGVTRVRTISNVVDPSVFRPRAKDRRLLRDLRIAAGDAVVGHFSTLQPAKRPLDIVESAAVVLRAYPGCCYLVAGEGPGRPAMERLARQHGIAAQFRFVGHLDHALVPKYMNLCDLVVMPSERESFSLVYREAQACGCVIVASDIPAAREAIAPNRTGALFRKGDARSLGAATLALLRNRSLRRRIARNARAAVADQSPRRWSQEYAEALQSVASGGACRQRGKRA